MLWRPVTNHLLDVCQHPHVRMREWGVEAVTYLVKAALTHKHNPPLKDNQVVILFCLFYFIWKQSRRRKILENVKKKRKIQTLTYLLLE